MEENEVFDEKHKIAELDEIIALQAKLLNEECKVAQDYKEKALEYERKIKEIKEELKKIRSYVGVSPYYDSYVKRAIKSLMYT